MKSKHSDHVVTAIIGTSLLFSALMVLVLFFGCAGGPDEVPEDMDPEELFQRAQEAVVNYEDYKTALRYYEAFLERYPDDQQNRVIAQYEIGFIYYKMEKYDEAKERFKELLSEYQGEAVRVLPQWPKVLSEKLLGRIAEIEVKRTDNQDNPEEKPASEDTAAEETEE